MRAYGAVAYFAVEILNFVSDHRINRRFASVAVELYEETRVAVIRRRQAFDDFK